MSWIKRLWSAVLCGYLALGATIQALPGMHLGGPAATGALVTAAAFATAAVRPFAGRFADRGAPVAALGAALVAAGTLAHLVARSVPEMAAARLVLGAGEGALFTGALAAVLRDAPAARRGRLIGHFGLSMWGGLAIGPVIGGLWFAAAMSVACVALAATSQPTPLKGSDPLTRHGGDRARVLPPVALRLGLLLGLSSFGYGTLNAFVATRTDRTGLALGLFAGAFVLARALGSRLVDDLGRERVARVSIAVEALALPFIPHPAALIALGAGMALVLPALMTWLVELASPHERGAATGAMTSCWDAGIALAGPLGGLAVNDAFALAALAAAAGALAPAPRPAVTKQPPPCTATAQPSPCTARTSRSADSSTRTS
jgi:MFS family permease